MLSVVDTVQRSQEEVMTYREIVAEIAKRLNLPRELVDKTYRGYWRAIKEHIEALPLKEDMSEEEFVRMQPNVNIPSLGKLNVTFERYKALRQLYKEYEENKDKQ